MAYRNFIDLHVHSDNSHDASHSVTLICEKAVEKGLRAVAVTDHCECLVYDEQNYAVSCRQSAFETRKAAQVFEGQIVVASGVELGCPARNPKAAADVMKNHFDFVVASVHRIKGRKDGFIRLDYAREANRIEKLFPRYLDDIAATVEWNGFDALAHLTYPLRYFPEKQLAEYDIMCCRDRICDILKTLAKNGKALEINTKGGPYITKTVSSDMHPCFEIVKLFHELGGEYITVGSDAHSAYDVGNGIENALAMAESAGFRYVTFYQDRIPMPLKIE